MPIDELRKSLELFNQKIGELLESRFVQRLTSAPLKLTLRHTAGEAPTHDADIPDKDSLKAAVLDLRFFIQNNERSSVANLAMHYQAQTVPPNLRERFNADRLALNTFLDSNSQLAFNSDRLMTYRDLMDIVVYGDFAHANDSHRPAFIGIGEVPCGQPVLLFQFSHLLIEIVKILVRISQINAEVLLELKKAEGIITESTRELA